MQLKEFSVTLGQLITEFQFELIYGPEGFEKIEITTDDVNRPGLQLAGFFDYFEPQYHASTIAPTLSTHGIATAFPEMITTARLGLTLARASITASWL